MTINYAQQKADFLDSLQPDDFRNGGSFNQAEIIIDQLNKEIHRAVISKESYEEFVKKAVTHLFRDGSSAVTRAINLAHAYAQSI